MSSRHDPYINKLIFSKYLIRKKVGKGSFGTVYQGVNTATNEKIALKVEKREKNDPGTLENEALRLVYLQGEGIPKVYCYGNNLAHNLLVEELLGKSLEDIFNSYGKPFSLKTVCVLGIEMIKRIQFIHNKHYIHRDIKPDNFMIGRGVNEKKIYIIDFGLAKKYYSVSKAQHIKFCTGKHLIGTARYCGRNAHRGYEQGRRDDIESIGYVLMYFLLGVLPWQGLKVRKNEDQFEKIAQKKYATSFEELTYGQPEEFLQYFKFCDNLKFEDQPNYAYLIGLFQNVINKYCRECYYDFDWNKDSYTHFSYEVKENNKSIDVSLIVNKNNDASAIDYSYGNEEEENDDQEDGNENRVNKKIKKNEIFLGEDKQPIENNEMRENDEDEYFKYQKKPHRSQSMVNLKKNKKNKKNKEVNNIKTKNQFGKDSIRNNKRNSQLFTSNLNDNNNINNNNEENYDGNNNDFSTSGFGVNINRENNQNNNNMDYDNQNSIQSSQRNGTNLGSSKYDQQKRKSMIRNDINDNNEYSHIVFPNEKGRKPRISNITGLTSIDPNIFHFDYKGNNNMNNEDLKNEEGVINNYMEEENTKDKENHENDNDNDNNWEDMNDLSMEEESKRKKRNRSGSVDDKKFRNNNNVKCQCFIF
jgi:serine/threonine protein kinase